MTTSKALLDDLRWEHTRTDLGQKPLSRIEWAAMALDSSAEGAARYHAAFEDIRLPDDLRTLVLDPGDVADARANGEARRTIRALAHSMAQRGRSAVVGEWVGILADRYPNAADALREAVAL